MSLPWKFECCAGGLLESPDELLEWCADWCSDECTGGLLEWHTSGLLKCAGELLECDSDLLECCTGDLSGKCARGLL